jgi:Family of unknown function (DUF6176)
LIRVELTRFRVKTGKSQRVREWMGFLRANLPAVLATLEGERMYVETIFREERDGVEYLYWYAIQGDGGADVTESSHAIDKSHIAFWNECIDPAYKPETINTEVVMIQKRLNTLLS